MNRARIAASFAFVLVFAWGCGTKAPAPISASPKFPTRIVCANTAATEFVARLVDADRLAGIPEQTDDYSLLDLRAHGFAKVPRFPRYLAESVLALTPDLVVTHTWQSADTTAVLRAQGIDFVVLESATSFEDIRRTLLELGTKLGSDAAATRVIADLDARVAKLFEGSYARSKLTALVYSNDGTGGSTAGTDTTIDTMFRIAGVRNAAAEAGIRGHQPLEFERLLSIDPDILVVAARARGEGKSSTKDVVESTAALAGLKARRAGRIVVMPAQLTSADSPPLVDAAELLAREVDRILAASK